LIGTGSIFSISSYLTPLIGFVVFLWILSVKSLNRQFADLIKDPIVEEKEDLKDQSSPEPNG
jgi:ATP/ADP translocase